jgi:hypothetical protein
VTRWGLIEEGSRLKQGSVCACLHEGEEADVGEREGLPGEVCPPLADATLQLQQQLRQRMAIARLQDMISGSDGKSGTVAASGARNVTSGAKTRNMGRCLGPPRTASQGIELKHY